MQSPESHFAEFRRKWRTMAEATIRDVARRAQVSIASVSRVLHGAANVSELTRSRIEQAVRELGFAPHAGARSLSMSRTNALGVVLPDLHGEFFSEIVRGMDREASARDYLLLLSPLHGGGERPSNALRAMRGRVDGLLLMAPHVEAEALAAALPSGLPTVLMNTRAEAGHASIRLDNEAGGRAVAEHFLARGRKNIVHLAGPEDNLDAHERAAPFTGALAARGFGTNRMPGDFSEPSGAGAVERLLRDGAPFGALGALRRAGLADTVAVAGFDDIPLARHLGLTTVRVRIAELGQTAVSLLLDVLERGDATRGRA